MAPATAPPRVKPMAPQTPVARPLKKPVTPSSLAPTTGAAISAAPPARTPAPATLRPLKVPSITSRGRVELRNLSTELLASSSSLVFTATMAVLLDKAGAAAGGS